VTGKTACSFRRARHLPPSRAPHLSIKGPDGAYSGEGLIDRLEQALSEKWLPDDIQRLIENIEADIDLVAGRVRQRETLVAAK